MNEQVITDGRSVRADRQRSVRREEILHAARTLISRKGVQDTSVADVIEAAGVSRGTFYLYFESFDALLHELLDNLVRRLIDCIEVVRKEDKDPVRKLYTIVRRVVDLLFDNPDLTRILLREAVAKDATVDRKLFELYTFMHRMICAALRNGAEWGFIRKVDEEIVAMAILGSIKEVLYQHLVMDRNRKPDHEALTRALLDFGLRGLARTA